MLKLLAISLLFSFFVFVVSETTEPLCADPNEHYLTCGSACYQPNCTNYDTIGPCHGPCKSGCFCNKGYVRKTDDSSPCVKIEDSYRLGAHDTVLQGSPLLVLFLPPARPPRIGGFLGRMN
ncbi:ZAN [Cordylochernes scorpioides]|uniref:ZAN n=1 Tax=Cordylochernes scorpioides TaxID=51811 RepID=A0ABY6LGD7_9ARAC|nr:ZAN [Cordylochernes scorpioides]